MTSAQNKEKISEPTKQSGIFPIDMSWGHMDRVLHNMKNHWPFQLSDDNAYSQTDLILNPKVDIKENEKAYEISAELPGLDVSNINIDVADKMLTISGEKRTERSQEKEANYHMMERRYGYFKRSFMLPESVKQEEIKARFKKGILHITVPKSESGSVAQHKIKIDG
jgi:HSP20 family protein